MNRPLLAMVALIIISGCSNNHKNLTTNYDRTPPPSYKISDDFKDNNDIIITINKPKAKHNKKIILSNKSKKERKENCSIMDRFDRKMVLAFEKDNGNIRYGFDIDGISHKSAKIENIMFIYRKRLNPSKTIKKSCKFNSSFQGLVGSVYNEFFIREQNTVWGDIKEIRQEIRHNLNLLYE